jgi:isopenicillin-N epimerase
MDGLFYLRTMNIRDLFLLDPQVTYLNHGSFGACPREIFDDYQNWQRILESEPVQFIVNKGPAAINESRRALAGFVGCKAENLVFVTNPTYAVNIIARSLDLREGDEVLSTDHEYGAMDRTWNYYCKRAGARYVNAENYTAHCF